MIVRFKMLMGWRLAVVFSLAAVGCLAPKGKSPEVSESSKIERRESVMPKSNIGQAPKGAGIDPRARDIENSLGIQ
jgi:hypothetical protein